MAAVTTVILSLKGLVVKDARPLSVFVETVNMDVVQTELHQQQVSCQSLSSMGDASGVHLSSVPSALPPAAPTRPHAKNMCPVASCQFPFNADYI